MFAILHDKERKPFVINLDYVHSLHQGENGKLTITALNPTTNQYEDKECSDFIRDIIQFIGSARNSDSAVVNHNFAKATTFKPIKPFA